MKLDRIDLYAYFGIERPDGAQGYLNAYVIERSKEFSPNRIRPAMLVIAGGGYGFVSEREKEPVALYYLAQGYNAFTLEYSIAPIKYPYQLLEGCMAMLYIKQNADILGVDPEHVAAIGFSAGGHLCAMLATISDEKEVKDFLGDKVSLCRPDAVILSYPVITTGEKTHFGTAKNISGGDEALKARLSLENRVTKNASPAFIWSTATDAGVPCENSLYMASAYSKLKVPFELHIFAEGVHGLSIATEEVNTPNAPVSEWFNLSLTWLKNRGFKINN